MGFSKTAMVHVLRLSKNFPNWFRHLSYGVSPVYFGYTYINTCYWVMKQQMKFCVIYFECFAGRLNFYVPTFFLVTPPTKMAQDVPKRLHIKLTQNERIYHEEHDELLKSIQHDYFQLFIQTCCTTLLCVWQTADCRHSKSFVNLAGCWLSLRNCRRRNVTSIVLLKERRAA
jgi:hypothetical protein